MLLTDAPKRFEDWEKVDCEDCAHWWDNSCDGVTGKRKQCNSYLAKRVVLIPEQLKQLKKTVGNIK